MAEQHTPKPRKPAYRKPCPQLPSGTRCPLCGAAYVCVQFTRPARAALQTAGGGKP